MKRKTACQAVISAIFVIAFIPMAHAADPNADAGAKVDTVDVCVYAATPSGIYAAVAVAREGKTVLLVEPSRWVGGMLGAGIKPAQDCPMRWAVGGLMSNGLRSLGNKPADIRKSFRKLVGKGVLGSEGSRMDQWELYDIEADRSELNDLADSQPERVKAMSALHREYCQRTNVLPMLNKER